MEQTKRTIFISDLHLEQERPDIIEKFFQLLRDLKPGRDTLYILGDLFETWIGDDYDIPNQQNIIHALHSTTQCGIPVYFMYGNRDFLIGNDFLKQTGCTLLTDETKLTLNGKLILLMHGDTLCTQDIAYMRARKFMRNSLVETIFLYLPLWLRKKIATNLRQKSLQHTSTTAYDIMDVTPEEVVKVMLLHNVTTLIHGHTHRPGINELTLHEQPAMRIVLGAWHKGGHALVLDAAGKCEFIEW